SIPIDVPASSGSAQSSFLRGRDAAIVARRTLCSRPRRKLQIRMPDPTYNLNGGFKPTMKRFADLSGPDFFPTPRWATFALIDNEKFEGDIWECACGDGSMSRVLAETGRSIRSSDLYDRGFGEIGLDFLTPQWSADNIVTNPPYNCAEGFVASGVKFAHRK